MNNTVPVKGPVVSLLGLLVPNSLGEIIPFVLTFLCCFLYYTFQKDKRVYEKLEQLPGPRALPILGNVLNFVAPSTRK